MNTNKHGVWLWSILFLLLSILLSNIIITYIISQSMMTMLTNWNIFKKLGFQKWVKIGPYLVEVRRESREKMMVVGEAEDIGAGQKETVAAHLYQSFLLV